MARRLSNLRKAAIATGCIVLASLAGTLFFIRDLAGGLHNALSTQYWEDRSKGFDEYQPELAWFRRGPRDRKEVCLTIDDGPHGWCTQKELEVLRNENVRATFFVVGKRMTEHPDLIRRMLHEGHEVGNHTQTHPRLSAIPLKSARKEMERCEEEFERITGRRMGLFRPPGMRDNRAILEMAKEMGYQTVDWNVGAHDFMVNKHDPSVTPEMIAKLKATPDQIADRVISQVKDGSIILLHDQLDTAEALPKIIVTLRAKGYSFVTCAEALSHIDHPVQIAANPLPKERRVAAGKPETGIQALLGSVPGVPTRLP